MSAAALERAEAAGLATTTDIHSAVQDADFVISMLPSGRDVLAVFGERAGEGTLPFREGCVVIDSSTIDVNSCASFHRSMGLRNLLALDAPVSGGVEGAKNGKLSEMVGGDAKTLERAKPVLEAYAARISHMGDVGAGQNTKSVNQVLVAGIAQATCEGLALGEALGLDPERLLPTLMAGAANSWFLEKRGATMLKNQFSVGFKLALLHKDLGIVDALAKAAGTDRSIIEKSLSDYAELMKQGHGDDDISALIRLKRRR